MAKAWLQSLVGTAKIPSEYTRETLATIIMDCISKDNDVKERVKSMLVSVDIDKTLPKTFKLRASRAVEILYGPE